MLQLQLPVISFNKRFSSSVIIVTYLWEFYNSQAHLKAIEHMVNVYDM